ncbi:hypothetical protein SK571_09650 [Lentzea sp. BCCO 10_0798]|uniref:Tetratricopeptide repeat-containing protein n=1 Tax=Lentzea kristufekii TaxID=3095430 RepID=A0ABU4TMY0_9PSEU|nr:hypothetical protein [Lentzea sp. BCCO 10_0798]MDX8049641.1 hypothetical protein [Lentzea sp. BCCO 10_0798]
MTRLTGMAGQTHLAALLSTPARMCVACGVDMSADGPCSQCGSPIDFLAAPPHDVLGDVFEYRKMLRKRHAMRIGTSADGPLFLLHDGKVEHRDVSTLKPAPLSLPENGNNWLSPAAAVLRAALALESSQLSLPWSSSVLFDRAFAHARSHPGFGRRLALDLMTLGHAELTGHCGLGESEQAWLRLVSAARRDDVADVVDAAAVLPADRYRHKIAVLAVFAAGLHRVRDAAQRLAPSLAAFADTEPLAGVVQRVLRITPCTPGRRREDVAMLAGLVNAPAPVLALATAPLPEIRPEHARLLGARGRVAAVHSSPRANSALIAGSDLDAAPLAVVDGLIDAGVLTAHQVHGLNRNPDDAAYLLARTTPQDLTDEQVTQVGHVDESVRRAHERGVADAGERAPDSAMGRHLRALDALTHNRFDDVRIDETLPEHADVVGRLATGLRRAAESGEAAAALDEVVLADRTTWQPLATVLNAGALLRGESVRQRFPAFADWLSLVATRERLFLADWAGAAREARGCLSHATDEAIRDEAHNLLACALHHLGEHGTALNELEVAIEGEYSVALLANIAVVATHLDRELAARHLTRVVREAPSQAMRANAAMRALRMWQSDGSKIWDGEDVEANKLPAMLREPLRTIITQPISLEEFREVARVLSRFDAEWLRAPRSLAASPHTGSLEAVFFRAKASEDAYTAIVNVLATITDWDSAPDWIRQERDDLVEQTKEFLIEHIDDPDNVAGVVALALARQVTGLSRFDQTCLLLLGVGTLTYHLSFRDEEIAGSLVDSYTAARQAAAALPEDERAKVGSLLDLAQRRIGLNLYKARAREVEARIDIYNAALELLDQAQTGSSAWFAGRHEVAETVDMCTRVREQLTPWLRGADSEDLRALLMDLLDHVRELETKARRVLGN